MSSEEFAALARHQGWDPTSTQVGEWATTATLIHCNDPALSFAAQIAKPWATSVDSPIVAAAGQLGDQLRTAADSATVDQTRAALHQYTHYVLSGAQLDPSQRLLLEAIEQRLIAPPPTSELVTGLTQWRDHLANSTAGASHPLLAAALANTQSLLLQDVRAHLDRVSLADDAPVSRERLLDLIDHSLSDWKNAATQWRTSLGRRRPLPDQKTMLPLQIASRGLQQTLSRQQLTPPSAFLQAALATSLGGNQAAAALLAREMPNDRYAARVVSSAVKLEAAVALLHANTTSINEAPVATSRQPSEPSRQSPPSDEAPSRATATRTATSPSPITPNESHEIDSSIADPAELQELVRRRDAGVIAAAALAGNQQAATLIGDASAEELEWLATDGRAAVARMVASMTGLAHKIAKRGPYGQHEDTAQTLLLATFTAAQTWSPERGRTWPGWAGQHMTWRLAQVIDAHIKHQAAELPQGALTTAQEYAATTGSPVPADFDSIVLVRQALSSLTDEQRRDVSARLGLNGGQGLTPREIAELTGTSRRAVYANLNAAQEALRPVLDNSSPHTHGWAPPTQRSQPNTTKHSPQNASTSPERRSPRTR